MNSLISDILLKEMTLTGRSDKKDLKFCDYPNLQNLFDGIFSFASKKGIYTTGNSDLRLALSCAIRHATERYDRSQRNKQKQNMKKM